MIERIYGKILTKFSISSIEYDYNNEQRWAIIIKIVNPCILRSKFYRKSESRIIFLDWCQCQFGKKSISKEINYWPMGT